MHEPFTVDHFREYARTMVLDSGEFWEPEPFQLEVVEDHFAGHKEIWLIVGEGNGKSTFLSGLMLHHLEFTPEANVTVAASSRDQTEILHRQAAGFVRRSPGFEQKFRVYDGYRRIVNKADKGRIQVYSADERTGDGAIPSLALLDELHRHSNLGLYRIWQGKLHKRGGQLIAISTAGAIGSEFEDVRLEHRSKAEHITVNGSHIRAEGDEMVLHDWAVPDGADVEDMPTVKEANPLSTITVESLTKKFASPTMRPNHWKRFVCNIASRAEGEGISPVEWDALADPKITVRPGTWAIGGIDFARTIDTTALVVLAWQSDTRRIIADVRILEPPVTHTAAAEALVELQRTWQPVAWAYDPAAEASFMVEQLSAGEHPDQGDTSFTFIEHSQKAPMAEACKHLTEAIAQELLTYDPRAEWSATLRQHALNAVIVETKYGDHRFDRPKHAQGEQRSKYPIDALTALSMAHNVAVAEQNKPAEPTEPLVFAIGR